MSSFSQVGPLIANMLSLLLILLPLTILGTDGSEPLVLTNSGWIRGLEATDGDYNMYMGIPYAKVNPDNPFGNAIPTSHFDDVFDAIDDTAVCPQQNQFDNTTIGTLDCLHVNVYVPNSANLDPADRLPVLVWVYGGHFEVGSSGRNRNGPKYLVRHDVILVTFNYRVGPYGFMCLEIPEVPGNQGLRDQQLAFAWITENIESFGGDLDRITVFGESAGAMSIDLHMTFKGLPFRNAVMQSGSAMRTSLLRDSNPNVPLRIAEKIGLRPRNIYEALQVLAMLPPATVIDAAYSIGVQYRPCVEKPLHGVDNFMTEYPVNVDNLRVNGMNILIGFNSDEELMDYAFADNNFYENWDVINDLLKTEFVLDDEELRDKLVELIRKFYIGEEDITELVKWDLCNFQSDWSFNYHIERAINKYLKNGVQNVYYNMFSYSGERNVIKRRLNFTERGAAHADDLGYLFDMELEVVTEPPTVNDQVVLDRMTTMWTNFAKYDDPTPELNSLLPVKWEPITADSPRHYLDINLNLTLGYNPYDHRMRFWDAFFEEYGKYEKGYKP